MMPPKPDTAFVMALMTSVEFFIGFCARCRKRCRVTRNNTMMRAIRPFMNGEFPISAPVVGLRKRGSRWNRQQPEQDEDRQESRGLRTATRAIRRRKVDQARRRQVPLCLFLVIFAQPRLDDPLGD